MVQFIRRDVPPKLDLSKHKVPKEDEPHSPRTFLATLRVPGPPLPMFGGGVRNPNHSDSNPVYGMTRGPTARFSLERDARRETDA